MRNKETMQSFLTAARDWERGYLRNYEKKHNYIWNKILKGGTTGLLQGIQMAMDRPPDSIPSKMMDGENLVNGEEAAVANTFVSFFRRKVEDLVETCKIESIINNGECGYHRWEPKLLHRNASQDNNGKPEGEKQFWF